MRTVWMRLLLFVLVLLWVSDGWLFWVQYTFTLVGTFMLELTWWFVSGVVRCLRDPGFVAASRREFDEQMKSGELLPNRVSVMSEEEDREWRERNPILPWKEIDGDS